MRMVRSFFYFCPTDVVGLTSYVQIYKPGHNIFLKEFHNCGRIIFFLSQHFDVKLAIHESLVVPLHLTAIQCQFEISWT